MSKRALMLWAVAALAALTAFGIARGTKVTPQKLRQPLATLPVHLDDWRALPGEPVLDQGTLEVLRPDDYLVRTYRNSQGLLCSLLISYFSTQQQGRMYHSPRVCMRGSGWEMNDRQVVTVQAGGRSYQLSAFLMRREMQAVSVLYWFQGRGMLQPDTGTARLHMLIDNVLMGRSDGAQVRLTAPLVSGSSFKQVLAAQKGLAAAMIPAIDRLLPGRNHVTP